MSFKKEYVILFNSLALLGRDTFFFQMDNIIDVSFIFFTIFANIAINSREFLKWKPYPKDPW